MTTNSFRPSKIQDLTIVNPHKSVVGHIRVKPSGVLWAPVNSKVWYGVSLGAFATFAKTHGKQQKK